LKDRDEAWTRVEALAMRHPSYAIKEVPNNNPFIVPQSENNSTPDEDGENEQITLTADNIEAKANEVSVQNVSARKSLLFKI
jgi:hypothetical protein